MIKSMAARVRPVTCAATLLVLGLTPSTHVFADTARPGKKAAEMTTAPMKANGSGVIVQYRIDGTPQAGAAIPVVLSFDGITDPAGAALRLQTEGGLALGGSAPTSQTLPPRAVTTLTIEVTPAAAGAGYLHVFTTQYGATSATSIPIQVGKTPSTQPSSGDLKQSADGEKIRSMQVK